MSDLTPASQRLFDLACAGELDPAALEELQGLLRSSAGARQAYLDYAAMHADLTLKVRASQVRERLEGMLEDGTLAPAGLAPAAPHFLDAVVSAPLAAAPPSAAQPNALSRSVVTRNLDARAIRLPGRRWPLGWSLLAGAVAATLLVGVFTGGFGVDRLDPRGALADRWQSPDRWQGPDRWPGVVASIRRVEGAEWRAGVRALEANDILTSGERIVLDRGLVEVEFRQGAVVMLEGPARLIAETTNGAMLEHGKVAAVAPAWATGFRLNTPTLDVVDQGTQFAVTVDGDSATPKANVVVTEGKVEVVRCVAESKGRRTLHAGEGVHSDGAATGELEGEAARRLTQKLSPGTALRDAVVVADRWGDWKPGTDGQPRRAGAWRHYTNARGPFGEPTLYEELLWDRASWSYRSPRWPSGGEEERYVRVHRDGGHPGKGAQQAADGLDHYSITSFTVPQDGRYAIEAGWIERPEPKRWDLDHVLDVAAHVNGGPVLLQQFCNRDCYAKFSGDLGELKRGDVVYVGVGPSGVDHSDRFRWGFFLVREVPSSDPHNPSGA